MQTPTRFWRINNYVSPPFYHLHDTRSETWGGGGGRGIFGMYLMQCANNDVRAGSLMKIYEREQRIINYFMS
jgi:hypothetical protein